MSQRGRGYRASAGFPDRFSGFSKEGAFEPRRTETPHPRLAITQGPKGDVVLPGDAIGGVGHEPLRILSAVQFATLQREGRPLKAGLRTQQYIYTVETTAGVSHHRGGRTTRWRQVHLRRTVEPDAAS